MKHIIAFTAMLFALVYLLRLSTSYPLNIPENQKIKISGRISIQPYQKDTYQVIKMGQIDILTDRFPGYFYGQKILVIGSFDKRVTNPFMVNYYSYFPSIQVLPDNENLPWFDQLKRLLLQTRGYLEEKINQLLPTTHSGLLLGVLLGAKSNLPENFLQNLQQTGTIHMLVASGQNVTLLAWLVMELLLLFLHRRLAVLITLAIIFLYVLMAGAEAPIVRAGIMSAFVFLAQLFGRAKNELIGLGLAVILMLLVSPLILFDVGFQLSFAATSGLVLLYPQLEKLQKKVIPKFPPLIKESFLTTLSAQLTTIPIIAANFGTVSLLSLPANILVAPVIPLLMVFGVGIIINVIFLVPLAQLLAWLSYPLLLWFVAVVNWFSKFNWSYLQVGEIPWWGIVGWYFVLVLLYILGTRHFEQSEKSSEA